MSDPISDTYDIPIARYSRARSRWIKTMADDARSVSVTKIHLPVVMAAMVVTAIASVLVTISFTAGAKATNLEELKSQVTVLASATDKLSNKVTDSTASLSEKISETSEKSSVTAAKVDGLSKQVDTMQSQIEQLRQSVRK